MNNCRGFSLLELLAVVAVVGILSAITIPNLFASIRTANEASAIASLRIILSANHQYNAVNDTFATPDQLYAEGYLDDTLSKNQTTNCHTTATFKQGYVFRMVPTKLNRTVGKGKTVVTIEQFYLDAIPESDYSASSYRTGIRWFYIDSNTNIPWIIDPAVISNGKSNPCAPGIVCFDLQKNQPKYSNCFPLN